MAKVWKLDPDALYLGDNGAAACGRHLGSSATHTGRDISGQDVYKVTKRDAQQGAADGFMMACEGCGRIAFPELFNFAPGTTRAQAEAAIDAPVDPDSVPKVTAENVHTFLVDAPTRSRS